jgi:putative RNA 2'-phosphotransferase
MSKFLSLVLRHEPGTIGIALDAGGWVAVEQLLAALAQHGQPLARVELEELIRSSDKQRFALSQDGTRIRANQGHSVGVDLGYAPTVPPPILYHGTVERSLTSIRERGLLRGRRHHVHLSATPELAELVARRRGQPVVLEVLAAEMEQAGHQFFLSANAVWLTLHVPARFIR